MRAMAKVCMMGSGGDGSDPDPGHDHNHDHDRGRVWKLCRSLGPCLKAVGTCCTGGALGHGRVLGPDGHGG